MDAFLTVLVSAGRNIIPESLDSTVWSQIWRNRRRVTADCDPDRRVGAHVGSGFRGHSSPGARCHSGPSYCQREPPPCCWRRVFIHPQKPAIKPVLPVEIQDFSLGLFVALHTWNLSGSGAGGQVQSHAPAGPHAAPWIVRVESGKLSRPEHGSSAL